MTPTMMIGPGSLDLFPLPSTSATTATPAMCGAGNASVDGAVAADARALPTRDAQVIVSASERRQCVDHVVRSTATAWEWVISFTWSLLDVVLTSS
jgi:hypothetical protein